MFRLLGIIVTRARIAVLAVWACGLAALFIFGPSWSEVGGSEQFSALSPSSAAHKAVALFDQTFPGQRAASNIVLVVSRMDDGPLQAADQTFISQTLIPQLRERLLPGGHAPAGSPVERVRAPYDDPTSVLLRSGDGRAVLVIVELNIGFLNLKTWPVAAEVERFAADLRSDGMPVDLGIAITGSAVLGRDAGQAEARSARAVQRWTIIVVIALLLMIYRAPLLALIPLLTVFVGIETAIRLLALISRAFHFNLYEGVKVYVTVVGYGAGVDYCLFLIARCREEWTATSNRGQGVQEALARVGPAITASAGTVIIGISMMGFADYGRIRQAGFGIAFSLAVVLAAALTLAPAVLCLTGRLALWPVHRRETDKLADHVQRFWRGMGERLAARPGLIGLVTVGLMAPFAGLAMARAGRVSYDLTRNLPFNSTSADGLAVLRRHFPAGATGPVIVLIENEQIDFRTPAGAAAISELVGRLEAQEATLGIADIRSQGDPLGNGPAARAELARLPAYAQSVVHERATTYYVGGLGGRVARIEVVLARDPYSESGLHALDELEQAIPANLPESLRSGAVVRYLGATAELRDLQTTTIEDRKRVDGLAAAAVFLVLLVLLRHPVLAAYLILTVIFGYLTTLGITYLIFDLWERGSFPGLDWKVSFFLFTILVAVGEDYNIFMVTRVREEESRLGPKQGVVEALAKTGGTITSCGAIMAGTFASLLAGALIEMHQMGVALSLGVILDALVIRPVLVPVFILLLNRWRARYLLRGSIWRGLWTVKHEA